ncbi:hypothetical protein LGH70_19550 [Hymenobacter sp. BT635]|uniref:Uncharacterized protein n=1 Tax=Hymenobacter nitidus TaxID=2880929 RepID=A0ABS8AHR6_9BACT|nr:hypothetical protein [Hymenobacter nitidus]MCB2379801.1 hypothetical protein [Hymenobacter nitidus]
MDPNTPTPKKARKGRKSSPEGAEATTEAATPDFSSTFEANPAAEELYVTSDNQAFLKEGPAKSHAKFLGDNTVSIVTRDDADDEPEEEEAN